MDGANYVHDAAVARRKDPSLKKWSYIVQDCFSAGSLPVELFTREFWNNVQDIVTTDGVVVMVGLNGTALTFAKPCAELCGQD